MTADGQPNVVYVTCPSNHRTGTLKASGKLMRCQRCFHELGRTVMLTVPPQPKPAGGWASAECWSCHAVAPRPGEKMLPPGWMTVMLGTDPTADKC